MTDWQPIETAPKDGSRILVWTERGCFSVEWNGPGLGNLSNEDAEIDWWYVDDGKRNLSALRGPSPTLWMPAPTPSSHSQGGWQRLETAPRDGTKFDAWLSYGSSDGYRCADVYWSVIQDAFCTDGTFGPEEPTPLPSWPRVTHWMPLPEPPAA